jgi:hypothetical protein
MIEEKSKAKKYKYITFMGDIVNSKYKTLWINRIQELTHWSRQKIKRGSTRP